MIHDYENDKTRIKKDQEMMDKTYGIIHEENCNLATKEGIIRIFISGTKYYCTCKPKEEEKPQEEWKNLVDFSIEKAVSFGNEPINKEPIFNIVRQLLEKREENMTTPERILKIEEDARKSAKQEAYQEILEKFTEGTRKNGNGLIGRIEFLQIIKNLQKENV